jgi:hypothetical protein
METAYEDLHNAKDGLTLAKAREKLNHLRHIAKVRARKYYGEDAQIQVNVLSGEQAQVRIRQLEQELGIG